MGSGNSKHNDKSAANAVATRKRKWAQLDELSEFFSKPLSPEVASDKTTVVWKPGTFHALVPKEKPCSHIIYIVLASKDFKMGDNIGLASEWRLQLRKYVKGGTFLWGSISLSCLKGPPGMKMIGAKFMVTILPSRTTETWTKDLDIREYRVGESSQEIERLDIPSHRLQEHSGLLQFVIHVEIYNLSGDTSRFENLEDHRKSFAKMVKMFLEPEGTGADVILRFTKNGNMERKVHRWILSDGSPVFQAMFQADMTESTKGVVVITDICAAVMEIVLDYIYTGRLPEVIPNLGGNLLTNYAAELVYAADKYGLDKLKAFCDLNLIWVCGPENAKELLDVAMLHKLTGATMGICDFIRAIA